MNDKYISRDNLELAIDGLKVGMTPNWNENDKNASGYIKNKPFYTEYGVIVDNYSGSGIRRPKCNFIVGNTYDVIWNGVKYKGLKCHLVDDYRCIGGDRYPFYIDDDGGNGFYVAPESGFTVSIFGDVVHQIDEKYIPDSIARVEDVDNGINEIVGYVNDVNETLEQKISNNTTKIKNNTKNININTVAIKEKLSYDYEGLACMPYDANHIADNLMYGNGKFVCVLRSRDGINPETNIQIYYSTDCINWTQSLVIDSCINCECVYGNGLFVIVPSGFSTTDYNKAVYYSSDGINWNYTTISPPNPKAELFYGGGKFLLLYTSSSIGFYSLNGIDWVQINTSILNSGNIVRYGTYANDKFFIVKYNSNAKVKELYQSDDFTNWTLLSTWTSLHFDIKYINDKFILHGNNTNTRGYLYSKDAINWTYVDSYSPGLIAYSNNIIVAKSNTDSAKCLSSRDGINWVTSQFPSNNCNYLFYLNGKFVALDTSSEPYKIYYSNDAGITWTQEINSKIVQNGEDVTAKVKNVILREAPYVQSPSTVQVGQTIVVSEVDENGKPTAWGAVDARSDWNQNDETAPDYVKNRTHYEEVVESVIVENVTLNVAQGSPIGFSSMNEFALNEIKDGVTYTVVWDGTSYECVANPCTGTAPPIVGTYNAIGNRSIINSSNVDSGEPFVILVAGGGSVFVLSKTSGTYTLSLKCPETVVHQIPHKYIKDVLLKSEQILTDDELTQVRNNLKFIGKNVTGQSFTIDGKTVVASDSAEIFGDYSTNIATGQWSIAEGSGTIAKGRASHAEGAYTQALNDGCHVEGYQTLATGYWSHAEGEMTRVTSYASHAEGSYCTLPDGTKRYGTASGYASHVEGGGCHATASCSHVEGLATTASGAQAHAEGRYTIAAGGAQHVEGIANVEDTEGKYIHIAGNGTFDARSNAHTLDWEGNAWFQGDVYVGSTSGNNKDEGSVKLQKSITGTPGQFVVIGDDGNVTTKTIGIAEEASF